jgi:hypothetical protein
VSGHVKHNRESMLTTVQVTNPIRELSKVCLAIVGQTAVLTLTFRISEL